MTTRLCHASEDTFWPQFKWPEFQTMPDKEGVVVVLPITGFADWGLELPLDVEERLSMPVLAAASERLANSVPHLVLPPLRFVLGPGDSSFFAMDPETAHDSVREIVSSVKESGFRKVVCYNSSPHNEAFLNAAARDLRIELGMQMFCINLSGIGLDLLEGRSSSRKDCRILAENHPEDDAIVIFNRCAEGLAELLKEVAARPGLANSGIIPKKNGDGG